MAEIDIVDWKRKPVRRLSLPDSVFAYPENDHLLWEAVRHYRAGGRSGTHSTKTRAEVQGAGRKLWRQKHTGRARVGSIRSPLWRKGGTVHGPRPRDYSYRLPKQMRRNALKAALSRRLREGGLVVLADLNVSSHKTREFRQTAAALLGLQGPWLWVDQEANRNLELAARNLPGVKVGRARGLNVVDVLGHRTLVLSEAAVSALAQDLQA
jgi:large subunit ribosomal protein L4